MNGEYALLCPPADPTPHHWFNAAETMYGWSSKFCIECRTLSHCSVSMTWLGKLALYVYVATPSVNLLSIQYFGLCISSCKTNANPIILSHNRAQKGWFSCCRSALRRVLLYLTAVLMHLKMSAPGFCLYLTLAAQTNED